MLYYQKITFENNYMFKLTSIVPKWIRRNSFWLRGNWVWTNGNISENSITFASKPKFRYVSLIHFFKTASNNKLTIGKNFSAKNIKIIFKSHDCQLIIGDNVTISGLIMISGKGRTVKIGDNTTIMGIYMTCRDEDISIGNDCLFSRDIEIRSTDVHKIYDQDTKNRINIGKEVIIGNKVWIGAHAFISKGSVIPNGSVVGATSFVNKPFTEENTVLAGTPAKIVKRNIFWER